ncbi:MAG: DUF927 domain-containing protein [Acinetobacter populi]|jgi:uncharacterized protein (DUF927 family)|uniref:DUF927 domain-containing protein n=1 Tax=Acinetobacter populi TaxID=1582270 RepID=UPI002353A1D9|nr:DUF927 domain-containing protein [Acinetobacter populi]MCH4248861.1 DUF927 domain-containing protein [Acinetobacter populi]
MNSKVDMFTGLDDIQQQADQFARSWVDNENQKTGNNYSYESAFAYTDEQGQPIYWKVRAKDYSTGDKFIRAFSSGEHGFKYGEPDYKALYPQGKGKKPLYALGRISNATHDDVIYIVEGEQKADYLNSLGLYATTCGGSKNASTAHLEPLKHYPIVVWPDNDVPGQKFLEDIADLLLKIGCSVRHVVPDNLELPVKGDVMDWVQARNEKGLHTTPDDIQALETVPYTVSQSKTESSPHHANNAIPKGHLAEPMQFDNGTFEILPTGVWYTKKNKGGDERTTFISSPVLVLAKTRDDSSNGWGRLLQWNDDAGIPHTWAISMQHFQTDGAELRKALADQGVTIAVSGFERTLFQTYLASYPIDQFALCVDRVGWHGNQYVLPCEVIGQNANHEIVVYQSNNSAINKYLTQGTLQDWQRCIAKRAEQHNFLVLALCTAFAGQLLEPLNQQGTGFHFKGKSSKGKSTAVFLACTVWGNPESYHHTWRNTSNALEQTAFMHNDGLLVLDEIGEVPNAKELGNIIYMLINGSGKGRMSKSLNLRDTSRWRLVFLSSGEKTLSELMGEAGQKSKLGQEIRLINIDIDQSEYGIFDSINFADDAAKQAILLNSDIKRFYGTAGKAWLDYLTQDKDSHTAHAKALIDQYSKALTANHTQGHIVRVANYFALVAAAGEMATQAGITTWQQGTAFHAVQAVFNHWLSSFEQVGDYEDREILAHVKAFFAMHGSSRFEHIEQNILRNAAGDDITPRIHNRVGYWKQDKDGKKYLVYPELFKSEICKGFDHKRVAKVLKAHDWLDHNANENMKSERIPDADKPQRMYVFNQLMWEWSDSENTTRNTRNSRNNLEPQGFDLLRNENTEHVTTKKHVTTNQSPVTGFDSVTCTDNQPRNNTEALQDKPVTCVTPVTCQKNPTPAKSKLKTNDDTDNPQGEFAL